MKSNTLIVNSQTVAGILSELIQSMIKEEEVETSRSGKNKKRRRLQQNTAQRKLRLNILYGCRDIFLREREKIKTFQLDTITSEQGDAIRTLKECIMKMHEKEDKENEIGISMRKRLKPVTSDPTKQISFSEKSYEELKDGKYK